MSKVTALMEEANVENLSIDQQRNVDQRNLCLPNIGKNVECEGNNGKMCR